MSVSVEFAEQESVSRGAEGTSIICINFKVRTYFDKNPTIFEKIQSFKMIRNFVVTVFDESLSSS